MKIETIPPITEINISLNLIEANLLRDLCGGLSEIIIKNYINIDEKKGHAIKIFISDTYDEIHLVCKEL